MAPLDLMIEEERVDISTTSKRCSKCGHGAYSKMQYDSMQDNLRVTCARCGYVWRKDPLDKEVRIEE